MLCFSLSPMQLQCHSAVYQETLKGHLKLGCVYLLVVSALWRVSIRCVDSLLLYLAQCPSSANKHVYRVSSWRPCSDKTYLLYPCSVNTTDITAQDGPPRLDGRTLGWLFCCIGLIFQRILIVEQTKMVFQHCLGWTLKVTKVTQYTNIGFTFWRVFHTSALNFK